MLGLRQNSYSRCCLLSLIMVVKYIYNLQNRIWMLVLVCHDFILCKFHHISGPVCVGREVGQIFKANISVLNQVCVMWNGYCALHFLHTVSCQVFICVKNFSLNTSEGWATQSKTRSLLHHSTTVFEGNEFSGPDKKSL